MPYIGALLLAKTYFSGLKNCCKQMHTIQGKKDYVIENGLLLSGLTKRTWKKFGNNFHTQRKTFKAEAQLSQLIFLGK